LETSFMKSSVESGIFNSNPAFLDFSHLLHMGQ